MSLKIRRSDLNVRVGASLMQACLAEQRRETSVWVSDENRAVEVNPVVSNCSVAAVETVDVWS